MTLSGDLTEIVYEIGAGDSVVGVDVTTVAPQSALELPIVGVGRFITAEGVLSVEPTLVLGDTQSAPADALTLIEQAGAHVELLEVAVTFDQLYTKIEAVGEVLDRESAAAGLVDRLRTEVEEVTSDVEPSGTRVAYVYTRGPDVMLLFGDGMSTQPLIEAAGAIDAGSDSGAVDSAPVSTEGMIAAAPDVIIVPEEGLSIFGGVEDFVDHPAIRETPAGRSGAILVYPEGDFLTFGPRTPDSLAALIEDLRELSG